MTSQLLAFTVGLGLLPGPVPVVPDCTVVRYAPDGRRTEGGDPSTYGVTISRSRNGVAVSTGGGARSRVASSTSGGSSAVSTSRLQDGDRTITIQTHGSACTVTIDERPNQRRNR